MNIRDLFRGEKFDTPTGALEPLVQIFAGFLFSVGLQLDDVKTLFLKAQRIKLRNQRGLAEQEHMGTTFRRTRAQGHQSLQRGLVELLGIIHQQVDFLPRERQLHHLSQNRTDLGLRNVQRLSHLMQHAGCVAGTTGGNHHTLHRLLVGTGHQGLTQQGLATALRAGDHQQQLAIAREVVQLSQHRLALGREKFEARHPWSERVMAQLVMAEERLVGMQTSHRDLINL
ncbi:hypothetical protein PS639_06218 [Pseudomonas fluorescens]|nr:hypothetical protein PS639_06218 [Pseudomonas fluorescens]